MIMGYKIIIVTTRDYPLGDELFEALKDEGTKTHLTYLRKICNSLLDVFKNENQGIQPTWNRNLSYEGEDLYLKRCIKDNVVLYVAPSLLCASKVDVKRYTLNVVRAVFSDKKVIFNNSDIYLLAHDGDLGKTSPEKEINLMENQSWKRVFENNNATLKNVIAYRHEVADNKVLFENKDYDIYGDFISKIQLAESEEDIYDLCKVVLSVLGEESFNVSEEAKKEKKEEIIVGALINKLSFDEGSRVVHIEYSENAKTASYKELAQIQNKNIIYDLVKQREANSAIKKGKRYPIIHKLPFSLSVCDIKCKNILDSSIWNYSIDVTQQDWKSKERIILEEISENKDSDYYDLTIAEEYADFNARLLKEANLNGEHGKYVSPFLFHSEWNMREKLWQYSPNINIVGGKRCDDKKKALFDSLLKYKWRFLLVDDKCGSSKLSKFGNKDIKSALSKDIIIKKNLSNLFGSNFIKDRSDDDKPGIYIDCAKSVNEALNMLSKNKYEIILLDYLLDNEFGHQLLQNVTKDNKGEKFCEDNYKLGPHNCVYFSFISAFTSAVNERLLAEGLHKSQDFWHIADGACPTNTPYLFLYNLLHLMKKRLDDMGLEKLTIPNYKENKEDFEECHIKSKIIDEIFISDDTAREENTSVRQRANDKFNKVLSLLYHYKNLLKDTHNPGNIFESEESVLATDFIEKNPDLGGFLEHLMQLVYLTAYGTVRQWPEMWEEYQFIKTVVGVQKNIENYILSLKNNNIGS